MDQNWYWNFLELEVFDSKCHFIPMEIALANLLAPIRFVCVRVVHEHLPTFFHVYTWISYATIYLRCICRQFIRFFFAFHQLYLMKTAKNSMLFSRSFVLKCFRYLVIGNSSSLPPVDGDETTFTFKWQYKKTRPWNIISHFIWIKSQQILVLFSDTLTSPTKQYKRKRTQSIWTVYISKTKIKIE